MSTYRAHHVEIDPARLSGSPVVGGTRLPTRTIAEYVWAGMSLDEVCKIWEGPNEPLDRRAALVALWYESKHGARPMKKAWREWGKRAGAMLWHGDGGLPDPPSSMEESAGKERR